jgi:hypothetical protein
MSTLFKRREMPMLHYWSEPSLADALSDPVVQAVMAADAVDPVALSALLCEAARKLEADCRPSRSAGTRASHTGISAKAQAQAESSCVAA